MKSPHLVVMEEPVEFSEVYPARNILMLNGTIEIVLYTNYWDFFLRQENIFVTF